jgi:predicted acylesterase/phospholipase RssA
MNKAKEISDDNKDVETNNIFSDANDFTESTDSSAVPKDESVDLLSDKPFGDIALCLSGGGYRAATYALGALSMLDELNLLNDVKLLSTVSGGTFTGALYALRQREGKSFKEFFDELSEYLKTVDAINRALEELYTTPSPSGSTDLSLIRSAAKSYQDCLFKKETFKEILDFVNEGTRFREIIFNATEFRQGNGFRFRASNDPTTFIGDQNFAVPKEIAGEIYLADIVAASSCFPGAFEPIRFPDDFNWERPLVDVRNELLKDITNPVTQKVYQNGFKVDGKCIPLPLMDGGVFDNQGITSAVLADKDNSFGLFLITDTSARDEAILKLPDASPRRGWVSLETLFWCAISLFIVCLAAIGIIGYSFFHKGERLPFADWQIVIGYVVSAAPAFLLILLLAWLYDQFKHFQTIKVSDAEFHLWHYFKKMALPDAIEIIKARISSVLAMASNVFMKRIRQLQFNELMNADSSRASLVAFNLIYDLNPTKPRDWIEKYVPELEPTESLVKLSKEAEEVPTTLWMTKKQYDTLVECGRATTCFALLKYLWKKWLAVSENGKLPVPKPNAPDSPYYEIYQTLNAKWQELNKLK